MFLTVFFAVIAAVLALRYWEMLLALVLWAFVIVVVWPLRAVWFVVSSIHPIGWFLFAAGIIGSVI